MFSVLQALIALIVAGIAFWFFSSLLVILTPAPAKVKRDHLIPLNGEYLRLSDGAELFVRHWQPASDPVQVVLALPGLGQHSGYHHRFGAELAGRGIVYYALDIRGNGLTRTRLGDVPSIERLYADLDECVQQLQARHPRSAFYVLGHSLGGALAACWAAERQPAISGLLILAPAMTAEAAPVPWINYLKGPAAWLFFPHRPVLAIDVSAYARERLLKLINLPAEVDFIVNDEMHLDRISMRFALTLNRLRRNTIALAPHIRIPTLTLVGELDPAYSGARKLYEAQSIADKTWCVIPKARHLLFHVQEMPLVAEEVTTWLINHDSHLMAA